MTRPPEDPHGPDLYSADLEPRMRAFNDAGVLAAADIHTALELARLTGTTDPLAMLGAAFAIRAPRFGHVFAQLDQLPATVTDEDGRIVELDPRVWPDHHNWVQAVASSPLVSDDVQAIVPLHLDGDRLYLDRYYNYERDVAAALRARAAASTGGEGSMVIGEDGWEALAELFPDNEPQLAGARAALSTRLSVIAGGPGTGKTATVASIVAVAMNHARRPGGGPVRVAVAAPTGKAAARLGEAMRQSAQTMPAELLDPTLVTRVTPTTLHRLLGWTPNRTRFRHNASTPLAYDLIVVDEVSMVALGMLARLLDAVPPQAHLVLVGDPDQLAAVEAGTVLGDLINGANHLSLGKQVVTLTRNYRSADDIQDFARAVRDGHIEQALDHVVTDPEDLALTSVALVIPDRPGEWPTGDGSLTGVRDIITAAARKTVALAREGRVDRALASTLATRVLCAHRRGPEGVQVWNTAIEAWVHDVPSWRRPEWYPGRPVIVTSNDYDLDVYNGDIGVVVQQSDGQLRVVIDGRNGPAIQYRRLGQVQTVHAMTVHKSQGSQFDRVIVVLPTERSPVLSRELLYTAITRAKTAVTIVGTPEMLADAIGRPVSRASALPERLAAG